MVDELIGVARAQLSARADPARARPMAAYMKTDMPFYGVGSKERREVARELRRRFPPKDKNEYRRQVLALWKLPHREEKYLAVDLATSNRRFVILENIDLYERLIREGAWWDLVDEVAIHLLGRLLLSHRAEVAPLMRAWIDDSDMWIRRSALISQTRHKDQTDEEMLFDFCLRRAQETEFFIRKAIGWALREYSKANPVAVRTFLAEHGGKLSGLSRREAEKHL